MFLTSLPVELPRLTDWYFWNNSGLPAPRPAEWNSCSKSVCPIHRQKFSQNSRTSSGYTHTRHHTTPLHTTALHRDRPARQPARGEKGGGGEVTSVSNWQHFPLGSGQAVLVCQHSPLSPHCYKSNILPQSTQRSFIFFFIHKLLP